MFTSFYFSNKLCVPYSASITTVRYSGALRCGWRHAQRWCVTVRYGGALRSCVTMVRYAVVTTCVTLVRYGALWWCVTLSATTRVMLIRYDSALHCHATIEMMNSLMHKSFFCLSNEACVIIWVMACGWRCQLENHSFVSRRREAAVPKARRVRRRRKRRAAADGTQWRACVNPNPRLVTDDN